MGLHIQGERQEKTATYQIRVPKSRPPYRYSYFSPFLGAGHPRPGYHYARLRETRPGLHNVWMA